MIRIFAAILTIWILSSGAPVFAGEPLYRYALRQGAPAPYEIYNLSKEPPSGATLLIHEKVHQAATASSNRLNLTFSYVNVAGNPGLTGLPPAVRRRWFEKSDHTVPTFLLFSPDGRDIYEGVLGADDVKATLQSPLASKLVKQLSANDGVALVLVSSEKSSAQDQRLEEQLKRFLQDLGEGRAANSWGDFEGVSAKLDSPIKVGFVHFEKSSASLASRDLCERSVAALLPAGDDGQNGPAVVIVFGRGRALPAKVGSAISPDQLLSDFATLLNPFDPAENHPMPGTNLLMRADWDKVEKSVRQRAGRREVVGASAVSDAASVATESDPAPSPPQPKTFSPAGEPAQISVVPPPASTATNASLQIAADFERVAVVGIVVAMLGLFMLTISIIRPQ